MSKFWCFTINNPALDHENEVQSEEIVAITYQLECGEEGTPHLQGYLQLRSRHRLSFLKAINSRAHWEPRKGRHQQALDYVTKADTRVDGPWTRGEWDVQQGKRKDLDEVKELIDEGGTIQDVAEQHFGAFIRHGRGLRDYMSLRITPRSWVMDVQVHWGEPGTGKTRGCYDNHLEVYSLCQNYNGGVVWWDGYTGQDTVLIDDFYGWLPFSYLLRLLDRYPFSVRTKDGHVPFTSKVIYITSNKPWEDWYSNIDDIRRRALMRRISLIKHYSGMG